jgi:hypothetical protein
MEVPMINWSTAFVIAIAMNCGAVLINKPSNAAFGGDGGMIATDSQWSQVWQLKGGAIRRCNASGCTAWVN